jgi:hypothetical protein
VRSFRKLGRYLALIVREGVVSEQAPIHVSPGVYRSAPMGFAARCRWALGSIPEGCATSATEFLLAIGASSAYARALPRWMRSAGNSGAPIHRVLTSRMEEPSWSPNAYRELSKERYAGELYPKAAYPLSRAIWTSHE